ncbi:MAG: hypothetical protein K9K66_10790 [Desulfarculaceae bacterium]|nr:hypothetical protein [Desulfarculaceae bacterium]MCF8102134.1 hypothetical protein [Desulfarculaceae bacterium]MCF8118321.1 hypothetical protein [Desulfarculaceae bacterium]
MSHQSQSAKPNTWALRLMGLMAENLHLCSEDLNRAYRDCIAVLAGEIALKSHKRPLAIVKKGERP